MVRRELACTVLFEDDLILVFLDPAPINPGHALLVPKAHHTSLTTVEPDCLERMMRLAPTLAQAIVREVDADGFNLHLANGQCAGQAAPHVSLHLVPRHSCDGFAWGWRRQPLESQSVLEEIAAGVAKRLAKQPVPTNDD